MSETIRKPAETRQPIHELLGERWSPRAFAAKPIPAQQVESLFEAARWAPSCFNEQPWIFIHATKADGEAYERLASLLAPANAAWATKADMLVVSIARLHFDRNGKPNRWATHDVGLATQNLLTQAHALGLATHAMGGFDAEQALEILGVPEGHEAMAMIAIGAPGSPDQLDEDMRHRELAARERKALADVQRHGQW